MSSSDAAPAILIVLITILLPPVGVLMVAGCGADFLINICLTLLGYIPGHIHAVSRILYNQTEYSSLTFVSSTLNMCISTGELGRERAP